jgi:hypothetical protein
MSGQDLTGTWNADDGGTYYITQIGNSVFWAGLSGDGVINNGLSFCNVFAGQIQGEILFGDWSDVPRGVTQNNGTLSLRITTNSVIKLVKINETGGFGGSSWEQDNSDVPSPPSLHKRLDVTYKNVTNDLGFSYETLLDNLREYHDYVVIVGTVDKTSSFESFNEAPRINFFYPDRTYNGFMCVNLFDELFHSITKGDGDITLSLAIDINQLNNLGPPDKLVCVDSPDFWNDGGWLNTDDQPPNGGIPQKVNFCQQSTGFNFLLRGNHVRKSN